MAASSSQIHNTVKDITFVAKKKFFGRDQEIEKIVQIFTTKPTSSLKCAHIALLGAGGQGKTETALQVMAHPAIKEYYDKKNSIWVPCDEATSPELFLDVLLNSLALNKDNNNTLEAILQELRNTSKPIILLLENFEIPWNAPEARGAVTCILQDIAQFSHVALFVTMRGIVAPCEKIEWEEIKIQPLGPEASHKLFLSIYPQLQHDPELLDLLEMVGHMALAVKLIARYGKNMGWSAKQLLSSYKSIGTSMLGSAQGSDAQNSVSVSICMSLESSLVKNELNSGQLLHIIARLPSGTTPDNLEQWWAPHLKNCNGAIQVLLETSLLECQTTTYFVLPVIRSYLLDHLQLQDDIHKSMVNAACNFLQQYNSVNPGEESFQNDMEVRSIEEINLQAILLQTSEFSTDVINALHTLAWHQCRVRPCTEVIQHAVKLLQNITNQHQLVANTFNCYAAILGSLNHLEDSLHQHNLAREAYLAASEPTLAARASINIADVSSIIDSSFNEIPLLEQAQHELESIDEDGKKWRMTMTHCLMLLGRAHSRHHNYSEALKHLTKAKDLCSDLPSQRVQCTYYLADAHHHLQQLDEAEKMTLQTINEEKQIGAYSGWSLWLLGRIYISKAEYNKAIKPLEEGLQIAKTYGNQRDTANVLLEFGRAYMKMSKYNDAKRSFSQALVNFGDLKGAESDRIVCQYYLNKLDDPPRLPTLEEHNALRVTSHEEDIPLGLTSIVSSTWAQGHGSKSPKGIARDLFSDGHDNIQTVLYQDDLQQTDTFILAAIDALTHIDVNIQQIQSLLVSHGLDKDEFTLRAGFNKALLVQGVGHLQQIFVLVSVDLTVSLTLQEDLGKIFSPYPGLIQMPSHSLFTPVFRDNGNKWEFDDLVLAKLQRFNEGRIHNSDASKSCLALIPSGISLAQTSQQDSNVSLDGSSDSRSRCNDQNNVSGGNGMVMATVKTKERATLMGQEEVAMDKTPVVLLYQMSDSHPFQTLAIQGRLITTHHDLETSHVQFLELKSQNLESNAQKASSAYQQYLSHITIDSQCGNDAYTMNRKPRYTPAASAEVKETTSKEISRVGQFTAAVKSLLGVPSLEFTGSTSMTLKTSLASERLKKGSRITQRDFGGHISWLFAVDDEHEKQYGLEITEENLPSVDFRLLPDVHNPVTLPATARTEVASYWQLPFPLKSQSEAPHLCFQNLCLVVALQLPSNLTQSLSYRATLQKSPGSEKPINSKVSPELSAIPRLQQIVHGKLQVLALLDKLAGHEFDAQGLVEGPVPSTSTMAIRNSTQQAETSTLTSVTLSGTGKGKGKEVVQ
ncbi:hypothetical protein C8J56DRAFT_1032569 [Mycena floridula]|nr:hypothetical protein C8J56DRAFT_1032569 [Mycena floridula]